MNEVGLDEISNALESFLKTTTVNLDDCLGEILSSDIIAKKSLPCFDNTALDGYAYNYADRGKKLKILGTILAGDKNSYEIKSGQCYKIMTGAIFPRGADTIVRLEDAKFDDGFLLPDNSTKQFNALRFEGEEIKKGEILLKKGEILTPSSAMYLASQGITKIEVAKKPSIAIFSTGDEIKEPWEEADESEIYNANATGISAVLAKFGFKSKYKGIIKDDFNQTLQRLKDACDNFDVIITSGGASKGEADFMHKALSGLDFTQTLNGIKLVPGGGPTKCYKKGSKLAFVLPGNPMAAFLMTYLITIPVLFRALGKKDFLYQKVKANLKGSLELKPNRSNIVYGIYKNGEFIPTNTKFGSGMIRPLVESNAMLVSKFNQTKLENGQILEILLTKV